MKSTAHRTAFTLLEVLIALGLSVLLVSAVYASIEMYYRYQTAGRAEIRGQQLLRGLTSKFSRDINSIVLKFPESAASTSSTGQAADTAGTASTSSSSSGSAGTSSSGSQGSTGSGSSTSTGSQSSTTSTAPAGPVPNFSGLAEAGLPVVFGIMGTADLLHLSVSLPARELNYIPVESTTTPDDRSGDLQIITIGLTSIDTISLSILQKGLKTTRPTVGLGRRTRDFFSSIATEETLEPQHLLAPEVTELTFRYFDSGEWFNEWDSVTQGRLPRAIEFDFGFWNPPPVQIGVTSKQDSGTVTHVQHVFSVPLSTPTVQ